MKASDLFLIILKVFGIYLIKDIVIAIPVVLYNIVVLGDGSFGVTLFTLLFSLLSLAAYSGICYLLLFKSGWIVTKLKLTNELSEEPLAVNLHRSSVYTIAIIVAGIVVLAFSVPQLIRNIYLWSQFMDQRRSYLGTEYFDYEKLLTPFVEVVIGLLFLGNQRLIVNFIESRRRQVNKVVS